MKLWEFDSRVRSLALMGRRSINLGRVRSSGWAKVLRPRHRLATGVALCLVLVLGLAARAGDGQTTTRAELVQQLEGAVEAGLGASSLKVEGVGGLIGVHFDTTLVAALRELANGASRPVYNPTGRGSRRVGAASTW